jgi:hypothetical protein
MKSFEVTYKDIERLDSLQLTDLLRRLLCLECQAHGIFSSAVAVSLKICEPDGGEDGRVQWDGGVDRTDRIPFRNTLFQSKAKPMARKECEKEVLSKGQEGVKPKIDEVLNAGGVYVLFCNRAFKDKKSREEGLRAGLKIGRRPDWQTARIEIYNGQTIADWTNEFLLAMIYVRECLGTNIPHGLKTWSPWSRYEGFKYPYAWNDRLKGYAETIRQQAMKARAVMRLVGLPGLGKTRLALEAFRPPADSLAPIQQMLSDGVTYYDAGSSGDEIVPFVAEMCNASQSGVLIVDDC